MFKSMWNRTNYSNTVPWLMILLINNHSLTIITNNNATFRIATHNRFKKLQMTCNETHISTYKCAQLRPPITTTLFNSHRRNAAHFCNRVWQCNQQSAAMWKETFNEIQSQWTICRSKETQLQTICAISEMHAEISHPANLAVNPAYQ